MKFVLSLILLLLFSFSSIQSTQSQDDPLQVVASTSIIADVAAQVGGSQVEITTLIPPGVDVHSFTLSPRHLLSIVQADLVLINGMGLEAGLLDTITTNAQQPPIIVSMHVPVREASDEAEVLGLLGDDLDCDDPQIVIAEKTEQPSESEDSGHEHGVCDPHVWLDVSNVIIWTENIAQAFAAADPAHREMYQDNATGYQEQLTLLDAELRDLIDTIPPEDRVLVTNHDFLSYFAATYGFTIIGTIIPGVNSAVEINPKDLARLVELVRQTGVPAIFAEVSDNTRLAESLAAEVGDVQIVELYSGSLSDESGAASNYLDYMRVNVTAIVDALQR